MYPTHTHFIKYKGKYLGKNNKLFGFITPLSAKQITDNMKYENMNVKQIDKSKFLVQFRPASTNDTIMLKPIAKKFLKIKSYDLSVGSFFASINNMEMQLIDNVTTDKEGNAILHSNFTVDDIVYVEYDNIVDHMNTLFYKEKGENIDYTYEMGQVIMDRYSGLEDDFL